MHIQLKLQKIGDSLDLAIPAEVLEKLQCGEGDVLEWSSAEDASITVRIVESAEARRIGEDIMRRYDNTLKALAK